MNAIVALKLACGLNTFPGRCDLDEDALPLDAHGLVERDELLRLLLRALLVEGQTCINLGRYAAGDNLQNLLAELDKLGRRSGKDGCDKSACTHQAVHSRTRLGLYIPTFLLAVLHSSINETGITRLSRSLENERRVGGSILGLVDVNCCISMSDRCITLHRRHVILTLEIARIRHDNGACLLEVVERGGHFGWWWVG